MPRLGVRAPLSPPTCPCSSVRKERRRPKSRVGGSNPSRGTTQERSSVWPERRSPKPVVGGSNPPAPANFITPLPWTTYGRAPAFSASAMTNIPPHPRIKSGTGSNLLPPGEKGLNTPFPLEGGDKREGDTPWIAASAAMTGQPFVVPA